VRTGHHVAEDERDARVEREGGVELPEPIRRNLAIVVRDGDELGVGLGDGEIASARDADRAAAAIPDTGVVQKRRKCSGRALVVALIDDPESPPRGVRGEDRTDGPDDGRRGSGCRSRWSSRAWSFRMGRARATPCPYTPGAPRVQHGARDVQQG
jgi:hypothetical protein